MSPAPGYHGWTHRPKEIGGVDPLGLFDPPYHIKVFSDIEAMTTGDGKFILTIPRIYNGFYLIETEAFVTTAGAVTVQLRKVSVGDVLSTPITIDATQRASADAAVQPVINQGANQFFHKDRLAIDVDAVSGAKGLEVVLLFEPWQIVTP